jgi:geranylgeranyl diphosphate synthase type II
MVFELENWFPLQQRRIEVLLAGRLEQLTRHSPPRLAEAMGYSLLAGGKRLRPVLCLAFADAVASASGGGGRLAEDAAVALECIHTYSLIHDDLPAMDDDDLRRGRPTSHKVYGEAMAILAGDALLTDAFTLLAGGLGGASVAELSVRGRLVAELAGAAGAAGMVGGQVLDIAEDRPAELDYLRRLHRMKTGALLKAACRLGVIAAGGTDAQLGAADTYGEAIGLGFQIADDLLDVTQAASVMGKPTGADAAAGRFTYPAVVGLERSKAMAMEQVDRAISAVRGLEPQGGPLVGLARYSVERKT